MKRYLNVMFFILLFAGSTSGQQNSCSVLDHFQIDDIPGSSLAKFKKVNKAIPVYFKYLNFDVRKIKTSTIKAYNNKMISQLNRSFNGLFTFSNKGYDTLRLLNSSPNLESQSKPNHLTIYMTKDLSFTSKGSSVLGFAGFPWRGKYQGDYIVLLHGNQLNQVFLNSLIHEVGHYFGLLHTHSNQLPEAASRSKKDANNTGDFIDDTGADPGFIFIHYKNPSKKPLLQSMATKCKWIANWPQSVFNQREIIGYSYTGELKDLKRFPVTDWKGDTYSNVPVNNFMSYHDLTCSSKKFTVQQKNRMYHFYQTVRKAKLHTLTDNESSKWSKIFNKLNL